MSTKATTKKSTAAKKTKKKKKAAPLATDDKTPAADPVKEILGVCRQAVLPTDAIRLQANANYTTLAAFLKSDVFDRLEGMMTLPLFDHDQVIELADATADRRLEITKAIESSLSGLEKTRFYRALVALHGKKCKLQVKHVEEMSKSGSGAVYPFNAVMQDEVVMGYKWDDQLYCLFTPEFDPSPTAAVDRFRQLLADKKPRVVVVFGPKPGAPEAKEPAPDPTPSTATKKSTRRMTRPPSEILTIAGIDTDKFLDDAKHTEDGVLAYREQRRGGAVYYHVKGEPNARVLGLLLRLVILSTDKKPVMLVSHERVAVEGTTETARSIEKATRFAALRELHRRREAAGSSDSSAVTAEDMFDMLLQARLRYQGGFRSADDWVQVLQMAEKYYTYKEEKEEPEEEESKPIEEKMPVVKHLQPPPPPLPPLPVTKSSPEKKAPPKTSPPEDPPVPVPSQESPGKEEKKKPVPKPRVAKRKPDDPASEPASKRQLFPKAEEKAPVPAPAATAAEDELMAPLEAKLEIPAEPEIKIVRKSWDEMVAEDEAAAEPEPTKSPNVTPTKNTPKKKKKTTTKKVTVKRTASATPPLLSPIPEEPPTPAETSTSSTAPTPPTERRPKKPLRRSVPVPKPEPEPESQQPNPEPEPAANAPLSASEMLKQQELAADL